MNAFTIKDVENLSGVKAHTIRIWEQRYDFLKPQRTNTNIRYYTNEELKKILNIALLNKFGFKISHINKMDVGEINKKLHSLSHQQARQERVLNELVGCMIDMDIEQFEVVLDEQIRLYNIDKTISDIIFPFMEKIGILWITNHIIPAQEHLVTNIIRQKLMVGIEETDSLFRTGKSAVLFLPEGEYHELGLLYVYYVLKNCGVKVFYLGADVPLNDLEYIVEVKKPSFVYSHLTAVANNFNVEKFIQSLHLRVSSVPVIISGSITKNFRKTLPSNFSFKKSIQEVREFVA